MSTADAGDAVVDRLAMRVLDGRGGRRVLAGHLAASSRRRGRLLAKRLRRTGARAVVGVAASQDLAHLGGQWSVTHVSDATFHLVQDFYPIYSSLQPWAARQGGLVERRAITRAQSVVTATEWARASVIDDYGKPPGRVHTIPFGPGCDLAGAARPAGDAGAPLRVLMVSSDWERKGGPRVLEVASLLRDQGVLIELTVVGDHPVLPPWVRGVGRVPHDDMPGYYATHDVLLELALANAAGVTLTDAAHAALPVVATHTGGTATIVLDEKTGLLVSPREDAVIREAVRALRRLDTDRSLLAAISVSARDHARTRLSWDGWAADVVALVGQVP